LTHSMIFPFFSSHHLPRNRWPSEVLPCEGCRAGGEPWLISQGVDYSWIRFGFKPKKTHMVYVYFKLKGVKLPIFNMFLI
jgi:hypothetical protein